MDQPTKDQLVKEIILMHKNLQSRKDDALAQKDEAQKDEIIEQMMTEMSELRKQVQKLTDEISFMKKDAKKSSKPDDSLSELEGNDKLDVDSKSAGSATDKRPSDSSPEEEDNLTDNAMEEKESNDGFQPILSKKGQKKIITKKDSCDTG